MATPMTPSQLLAALKAEGLEVKEYTGWRARCRCCPDTGPHKPNGPFIRGWGSVNGTVTHITAGSLGKRSVETYIRDIINGDPKVPCKAQIVTAPDGVVWLNSAGRCNHAGEVGRNVQAHLIAADFSTSDDYDSRWRGSDVDGNAFTYGNEVIAASEMNTAQYDAAVKVAAAIARHYGWTGQESVGHGEISGARVKADPGLDMGKFRRDVMARVAGTKPKPPVVVPPKPAPKPSVSKPHEYISANLADYDTVGKGERTAEARANKDIPNYLLPKAPEWFHFQECSKPTLDEMDKRFAGYTRVPEGGKGRESFYDKDAGIKILGAELSNVTHMLLKDTKEFLKIAWEDADGFRGVYVNFHNENEGSTFQTLQLWDVMKAAVAYADKFGIDHRNIVITGDGNLRTARQFVKLKIFWREARDIAKKKIDLIYKTTHGWTGRLVKGSPIDVDIFHKDAVVDEAEMLFGVIADHFARRVIHRLFK